MLCSGLTYGRAQTATTAALKITFDGNPVSSVAAQTAVKMTATVLAGSAAVTPGQVEFCDADAGHCVDFHLLGLAQLTPAGTATLTYFPPRGLHHYKAIFLGTNKYASSVSAPVTLQVEGAFPTTTTLSSSGSAGSYTLSGTVSVTGAPEPPSGTVEFLDQSHPGAGLGSGSLLAALPSFNEVLGSAPESTGYLRWVGDFNGDGLPDLAASNNDNVLNVMRGNGDGTFSSPDITRVANGDFALPVTAADFNGDGRLDLAWFNSASVLQIFLGNGNGGFEAPLPVSIAGNPFFADMVTGDFNHDGIVDLALHNDGTVLILLGNGDGTFKTGTTLTLPYSDSLNLRVADFNGDGKADLVWSNGPEQAMGFAYGKGDGTFEPPVEVTGPGFAGLSLGYGWAIADFNGDGLPDLVVGGLGGQANVAVLINQGDGSFAPAPAVAAGGVGAVGDFNGDGIPDVYSSSVASGPDGPPYQLFLLGNGDGTFTPVNTTEYGISPDFIADIESNGLSDILSTTSQFGMDTTPVEYLTQITQTATATSSIKPPTGAPATHEVAAKYDGFGGFASSESTPAGLSALTGSAPVATLSTTVLQFSEEPVDGKSGALAVFLVNQGTAPLQLGSIAVVPAAGQGAAFTTANGCPSSLAAAAACKIYVQFHPLSAGDKVSQLTITDNAGNSPQVIMLLGTAVGAP